MSETKDKEHSDCFVKLLKLFNACCGCLSNSVAEGSSVKNIDIPPDNVISETVLVLEVNKIDSQIIISDDDFINIDKIDLSNEIKSDLSVNKNVRINTSVDNNTSVCDSAISFTTKSETVIDSVSENETKTNIENSLVNDEQNDTNHMQVEESITKIVDNNLFEKRDNYF